MKSRDLIPRPLLCGRCWRIGGVAPWSFASDLTLNLGFVLGCGGFDSISNNCRRRFLCRLQKFAELKFRYMEEDRPEEFFVPYVWSLVYRESGLHFNASRIHLFAVQTPPSPVAT